MKKIFEKYDLFKIVSIFVLIAFLLTWFVQIGYFQDGELIIETTSKLGFWNVSNPSGIFDLGTYSLLLFYYFPPLFVFILVCAGFYTLLGSLNAYQKLTTNIANKLKGHEKIVLAGSTLIFACLSGIISEHLALLVIIPFVISILSKLNVDKVTGVSATFGGVLVGILGSTYSAKITGYLVSTLGVKYGSELISTIIIFAIAYLLLVTFTVIRFEKTKKDKKANLLEDIFTTEVKETKKGLKNVKTTGLLVVLVLTFILAVISMISWSTAFEVNVFSEATESFKNAKLFGVPIFSYLLGTINPFGEWDLLTLSSALFIATLVIKILYRIPVDSIIEKYADGIKRISRTVIILVGIYLVLLYSVMFPVTPVIVNAIMKLGNNIFTMFISGVLTSIFTVDFQYCVSLLGGLFKTFKDIELAGLTLQSAYGIVSFIVPTSAIMMLGLSMTNTKYSEWFKFIWKFVLAMLVVTFIVLAIVAYA